MPRGARGGERPWLKSTTLAICVAVAVLVGVHHWWPRHGSQESAPGLPRVHQAQRIDLGSFELESNRIVAADPTYADDDSLRVTLAPAAPGQWDAWIGKADVEDWGTRAVELGATKHGTKVVDWKVLDTKGVGVDSGQAGLFDPKYINQTSLLPPVEKWASEPIDRDNLWYSYCSARTLSDQLAGVIPHGVVSASGVGDGLYRVLESRVEGQLVGVRLIFIEEDR